MPRGGNGIYQGRFCDPVPIALAAAGRALSASGESLPLFGNAPPRGGASLLAVQ
ncbi:MAG: hypothetical protein ACRESY_03480 [Steroidobacteraceae bacterium]